LLSISYLFGNIALINGMNAAYIYLYGAFVFLSVYAYTELMDRNPFAVYWEGIKNVFGIAIIIYYGDWFGASRFIPLINYFLIAYFISASIITTWFVYFHSREDGRLAVSI